MLTELLFLLHATEVLYLIPETTYLNDFLSYFVHCVNSLEEQRMSSSFWTRPSTVSFPSCCIKECNYLNERC